MARLGERLASLEEKVSQLRKELDARASKDRCVELLKLEVAKISARQQALRHRLGQCARAGLWGAGLVGSQFVPGPLGQALQELAKLLGRSLG